MWDVSCWALASTAWALCAAKAEVGRAQHATTFTLQHTPSLQTTSANHPTIDDFDGMCLGGELPGIG